VIEKPAAVRVANHTDERKIFDLLVAMHRYNQAGWSHAYDPLVVMRHIEEGTRPNPATRTDPNDQRRALIGVVDGPDGDLVATIGLFVDPATWFTGPNRVALFEIWFFVQPEYRHFHHEEALRDFALWVRQELDPHEPNQPFHLFTGFMHQGRHWRGMMRLWERLWPMAKRVGSLWMVD
jgi:hypothetical protein